ncbi:MAG: hypothetical protein ACC707_15815 [Thiohalomonadales bacterium]
MDEINLKKTNKIASVIIWRDIGVILSGTGIALLFGALRMQQYGLLQNTAWVILVTGVITLSLTTIFICP